MNTTNIKRSPLTTDEYGLSFFIQREGESLPENQYIRELTLNGFEAEATKIWIDHVEDKEVPGRQLFRLTDNGHGMTEEKLREHIKSLFRSGKELGPNHGMGARIATLARNPCGVTWASRVGREENMVMVIKDKNGVFALEKWLLSEPQPDGSTYDDVVDPDDDYLLALNGSEDGTVVILHGNGVDDTWISANSVAEYINTRFWTLPGEIRIWQETIHGEGPGAWRKVLGLDRNLERDSIARGKMTVCVEELDVIDIHWALLKETADQPGTGVRRGKIGVLLDNELFEWGNPGSLSYRMTQFGIMTRPVQNRLVIVAELPKYKDDQINGWRMNIGRDGIERAGGRNSIDWSKIGDAFCHEMPPEIAALMIAEGNEADFLRIVQARLSENWKEIIQYLPKGENDGGKEEAKKTGTIPIKRKRKHNKPVNHEVVRPPPGPPSGQKRQAKDKEEDMPGVDKNTAKEPTYQIPKVKWVSAVVFGGRPGRAATFSRNANEIQMVEDHIFILQATAYARKEYKKIQPALIVEKVQHEFGIETLAKVLHINILHGDANFSKEDFDALVSDDALTLSIAGAQSVMERIHKSLRHMGK